MIAYPSCAHSLFLLRSSSGRRQPTGENHGRHSCGKAGPDITWYGDTSDDRKISLFERPGGSRLAEQLKPGDFLLLANNFPYATPFNIPEVFSFIANCRITVIHVPGQIVLEPDAVSQFLPTLDAIIDHVALQIDALMKGTEEGDESDSR